MTRHIQEISVRDEIMTGGELFDLVTNDLLDGGRFGRGTTGLGDFILNMALRDSLNSYRPPEKLKLTLAECAQALPGRLYSDVANPDVKNKLCPIMQVDFDATSEVTEMKCCGQLCFKESVWKWLSEVQNSCPLCRQEVEMTAARVADEAMGTSSPQHDNGEETENESPNIQIHITSNMYTFHHV